MNSIPVGEWFEFVPRNGLSICGVGNGLKVRWPSPQMEWSPPAAKWLPNRVRPLQSYDPQRVQIDLNAPVSRRHGHSGRLNAPSNRLHGHSGRLNAPSNRLHGHSGRLNAPSNRLHGHSGRLNAPVSRLHGHSGRLNARDGKAGRLGCACRCPSVCLLCAPCGGWARFCGFCGACGFPRSRWPIPLRPRYRCPRWLPAFRAASSVTAHALTRSAFTLAVPLGQH